MTAAPQPSGQLSPISQSFAASAGRLGARTGVTDTQAGEWFAEGFDFKSNPSAADRANLTNLGTELHGLIRDDAALFSLGRDGVSAISRCAGFLA